MSFHASASYKKLQREKRERDERGRGASTRSSVRGLLGENPGSWEKIQIVASKERVKKAEPTVVGLQARLQ